MFIRVYWCWHCVCNGQPKTHQVCSFPPFNLSHENSFMYFMFSLGVKSTTMSHSHSHRCYHNIVSDSISIIESSSRLNDCENWDLLQIWVLRLWGYIDVLKIDTKTTAIDEINITTRIKLLHHPTHNQTQFRIDIFHLALNYEINGNRFSHKGPNRFGGSSNQKNKENWRAHRKIPSTSAVAQFELSSKSIFMNNLASLRMLVASYRPCAIIYLCKSEKETWNNEDSSKSMQDICAGKLDRLRISVEQNKFLSNYHRFFYRKFQVVQFHNATRSNMQRQTEEHVVNG